jgi:O-antigen/teichoic acid export membrane protein
MSAEPRTPLDIAGEAEATAAVTAQDETPTASGFWAYPSRLLNWLPAKQGAFWILFATLVPKLFGPIFTIGLRRFLGPGAAGLFDISSVPYKFLDNFRNFGTGPALVYERKVSKRTADTAWTLNMILAVVVGLVLELIAHPWAQFDHRPEVEGVIRVLAIAYIFASLTSVHFYLLLRDMDFRARAIPPVGQVIVAGDIAVIFAIWGFGVGALVGRELASVISGAIILWFVYPYRPTIYIDRKIAWDLFSYGAWVGMGLTVLYLSQNIDLLIGPHFIKSTSDMGFYSTSWKLAFIAASVFTLVASGMVFPALSRLRGDIVKLRETLIKSIRQLGLVMFPAAALLATVAPVIIVPLLGTKWEHYRSTFIVLTLLAVYAGNRTMLSVFFEAYKSIGKPWIVPIYNGIKLAAMIPAMAIGAQFGIVGLAFVYIPVQIIEFPAALILADRVLDVSPLQVWSASRVPLISTFAMTAATLAVELLMTRGGHVGNTATLGVCLVVAGCTYLGSLYVLDRSIIAEGRAILIRGL